MREGVNLGSPIGVKINWAEACFLSCGEELLRDKGIARLLEDLERAISGSRREMVAAGIVETCRKCEELEGGSCCGAGLEDKYDGSLLLINLLLGVELPKNRREPGSCFFLGDAGCVLQARHVICVNYICGKAAERSDPVKLTVLREREGEELETLFRLHERVKGSVAGRW